jgi:hypothetical protein
MYVREGRREEEGEGKGRKNGEENRGKNQKTNAGIGGGTAIGSELLGEGEEVFCPHKFFDKADWLTTKEAAIYLRKFRPNGRPSVGAIYMLLERGRLRKRKFFGRLYFNRREIERSLESANSF